MANSGDISFKGSVSDFQGCLDKIDIKIGEIENVIQAYDRHRKNLDQVIDEGDSSYQLWLNDINEHVTAAQKTKAELTEVRAMIQTTVDQMTDYGNQVATTVGEAAETLKNTVEAAITIAPLL